MYLCKDCCKEWEPKGFYAGFYLCPRCGGDNIEKIVTVADLIDLKEAPIWDYRIYGPLSFDDEAVVRVYVEIGKEKPEEVKEFILKIVREG